MTSSELHDKFWSSLNVEVVRLGQNRPISGNHQCFLLLDESTLALFPIDRVRIKRSGCTRIRIHSMSPNECREIVVQDAGHRFVRFERVYQTAVARGVFGYVTRRADIANEWIHAESAEQASLAIKGIKSRSSQTLTTGGLFDGSKQSEEIEFIESLIDVWNPTSAFEGLQEIRPGVFASASSSVSDSARFFGRAWVSFDSQIPANARILGPALIENQSDERSSVESKLTLKSGNSRNRSTSLRWPKISRSSSWSRGLKRAFDICFSLLALALTLPFYPFIMLAILIEDGRPIFFGQRRETLGGREFLCWKFRSMCHGAERMRAEVSDRDVADGPQLFVPRDPRMTRIGLLMRAAQIDEWPQFFNVLRGDMSVVGPRPLAFDENQWCPAWREARLSVRAGVTGLWQVLRTRRTGLDFQEWVKYDIQYVEQQSFRLDLRIIWESVLLVFRGPVHRELIRIHRTKMPKRLDSPETASQWNGEVDLSDVSSELDN